MLRVFLYSLGLLSLTAAAYFSLAVPTEEDEALYLQFAKEDRERKPYKLLEDKSANQSRQRVRKDVWTMQDQERTHLFLTSARSELKIFQSDNKLQAEEHLSNLSCQWQEGKEVRVMKAEKAVAHFPSKQFRAENVEISSQDPVWICKADEAYWMDELSLKGNVRWVSTELQGKKSFAVSDQLSYDPKNQSMRLSCLADNRVLFWQEGFSLSASGVEIRRDPKTGTDEVSGIGDIRCCLSTEEKNRLNELFEKYL